MTRNKSIVLMLLALTVCLVVWHVVNRSARPVAHADEPAAGEPHQTEPPLEREQTPRKANTLLPSSPQEAADLIEHRRQQKDEALHKAQDRWRTPIEFYGKVVDENTNPVADAQVAFDCNDTSAEGTSFYHVQSDANGLFSIRGIQG